MSYKKCSKCKITLPTDLFFKSSKSLSGLKSQCKSCHASTSHARRDLLGDRSKDSEWRSRRRKYLKSIGLKVNYLDYRSNKKSFLSKTYCHMRARVKGKEKSSACGKKLLDRSLFIKWSLSDHAFNRLFDDFKKSGYLLKLCPSIDRISVLRGYEFGNIQWLSFSENVIKGNLVDKFEWTIGREGIQKR